MSALTSAEVARRAGIAVSTLRRWDADGLIPRDGGPWTEREVSHVRMLLGLRNRGYSMEQLREGVERGTLAIGYIEQAGQPAGVPHRTYTFREAARELGLEVELLRRFHAAFGLPSGLSTLNETEMALLRHGARVLNSGLPLVASLQIARVYGQALAQIADAEVRLVHLYVHEPLLRDGVPNLKIAKALDGLASDLLPVASPILDLLHQRYLQYFVEQDVVGHLEQEGAADARRGEIHVAIAFADLAGFTRLTEEEGDLEAVSVVERFFEQVERSLPEDCRIIKTIGDEVMVVGSDPGALLAWAVQFQQDRDERPLPRIGVHSGPAIFRDGDYYGREINRAARIVTRGAGGEVIVTGTLRDAAHLRTFELQSIGSVRLKGFEQPEELFVVRRTEPDW
ncbi:MAG: adenylate/guanylate cyclase domain-containing protein [Solirubrobacteraceae bacterium]|nr:adenylate/guanylate cyclase domain-containing protein [Patulibacter sp.]